MLPLQTVTDPAMAVAVLGILLTVVVPAAFLWAFGKIREPPDTEGDDETDRGSVV
jgi:hypothetical protein